MKLSSEFTVPYRGSEARAYLVPLGRRSAIKVDLPQTEQPKNLLLHCVQRPYNFARDNLPTVIVAEFYEGGVLRGIRIEPRGAVRRDQQWPLEPRHVSEILQANYRDGSVPYCWFS